MAGSDDPLPIRMLHDRVLVSTDGETGERRSTGGIVIPATVAIGVGQGEGGRRISVGKSSCHGKYLSRTRIPTILSRPATSADMDLQYAVKPDARLLARAAPARPRKE